MIRPALVWVACVGACGEPGSPPPIPARPADTGATPGPSVVVWPLDMDGDGWFDTEDCAPRNPSAYPGAPEVCNGRDDDCDGALDPWLDADSDGDGFLGCDECDDFNAARWPGALDTAGDGVDQDCDGTDGVGTSLPAASLVGATINGLLGFSLAAADFDGDGLDDLLAGQPSNPLLSPEPNLAVLWLGGQQVEQALTEPGLVDNGYLYGYDVDLQAGLAVVTQTGYRLSLGRALVYDVDGFGTATPRIDLIGGGGHLFVGRALLLGEPASWVAIQSRNQVNLVSLTRTGVIDLVVDRPDGAFHFDPFDVEFGPTVTAADVGDRDGDGQPDLVMAVPTEDTVFAHGEVVFGLASDAPEQWTDPGLQPGLYLDGGEDLDGDGADDMVVTGFHPERWDALRSFVVPWRPGQHVLPDEAPARLDGELVSDWSGHATAIGDYDGDGAMDLAVGAPGNLNLALRGKVLVFRGPLSGVLTRAEAAGVWVGTLGDHAGEALAALDRDGDGVDELAVAAPFADVGAPDAGVVYLLEGVL